MEKITPIKYQGFKILKLNLMSHPILGKPQFQFVSESETNAGSYSTIIIGPNGTGKSHILRVIIDIFREIDGFIKNEKREQHVIGEYSIVYSLSGNVYEFGNVRMTKTGQLIKIRNFNAWKNGEKIRVSELKLPSRVLASSIMLTDKFPVIKEGFEMYEYLGVRRENNPGTAGTRTYISKTVDYIVNSIEKRSFRKGLFQTLSFLDLSESFIISYSPRYRNQFFSGNVSAEYFYDFHKEFWNYTRRSQDNPPWSKQRFDNHTSKNPQLVGRLADFCNYLSTKLVPLYPNSRSKIIEFNLTRRELDFEQYELIKELRALDLLSYPSITLSKNQNVFDLEESSSGEYHFLSTMIGILANLEDNSLILIDEPEISLHPNWQMKYMSFLHKMLKDLPTCHAIVATHSHFLISDLEGASSAIIGLRSEGSKEPEFLDYNTYGWSAEQVLLEIFKVPTTRNYFIAEKIGDILELISKKEQNTQLINSKVKEMLDFKVFSLPTNDPLSSIWKKIVAKYGQES